MFCVVRGENVDIDIEEVVIRLLVAITLLFAGFVTLFIAVKSFRESFSLTLSVAFCVLFIIIRFKLMLLLKFGSWNELAFLILLLKKF